MKKLFSLFTLLLVLACGSNNLFNDTKSFQKYLDNNKGLYVGFVAQCKNMQSALYGNNQYDPEEYCDCLPKAIAFCVYSQEKILGQNVSSMVFKDCIMQGSNTCKATSANKLDILNEVIFNY